MDFKALSHRLFYCERSWSLTGENSTNTRQNSFLVTSIPLEDNLLRRSFTSPFLFAPLESNNNIIVSQKHLFRFPDGFGGE